VVSLLLLAVWAIGTVGGNERGGFWPAFPLAFMWFGVMAHARRVRPRPR
jgi:hypothetical protein